MPNSKISALTSATTPLAGTETLPIVQGGVTKQVSIANLTAGRAVSAASLALTTPLPVTSGGTGTGTAFTAGSVVFAGASGVYTQNNANFFWDNTNSRLGVKTATPSYNVDVIGNLRVYGDYAVFLADPTKANLRIGSDGANDIYLSGSVALGITGAAGINLNAGAGLPRVVGIGSTGNVTIDTGNIIQGTAAKGINFTANTATAGSTSQLLNWYEEGTWTPNQGAGLTVVGAFSSSGTYTRIGRQVMVRGQVVGATSVAVNAAGTISSNLPFTAAVTHAGSMFNSAVNASGVVQITSTSVVAATTIAATPNITFSATYTV